MEFSVYASILIFSISILIYKIEIIVKYYIFYLIEDYYYANE